MISVSLGGAKVIFEVRLTKNVHCDLDQEKCVSFPTRLLTRSASTVQTLTSWSSPKARSHGQGAMNDISHDVPARPVHNHVLWTSSAPNAPHQCGHVDMWKPFGRTQNEEKHPPNHLHELRSVWSPERGRQVSASSTGKAPVPQAKTCILR